MLHPVERGATASPRRLASNGKWLAQIAGTTAPNGECGSAVQIPSRHLPCNRIVHIVHRGLPTCSRQGMATRSLPATLLSISRITKKGNEEMPITTFSAQSSRRLDSPESQHWAHSMKRSWIFLALLVLAIPSCIAGDFGTELTEPSEALPVATVEAPASVEYDTEGMDELEVIGGSACSQLSHLPQLADVDCNCDSSGFTCWCAPQWLRGCSPDVYSWEFDGEGTLYRPTNVAVQINLDHSCSGSVFQTGCVEITDMCGVTGVGYYQLECPNGPFPGR